MIQPRLLLSLVIVAGLTACQADSTSPVRLATGTALADRSGATPGSIGGPIINVGDVGRIGRLRGCTAHDAQFGKAIIGPSGGELIVGKHRLIVPAGALTETVTISGTSPADSTPTIYLEPHGLQFRKSAGLILDVSNCTEVPSVVYISEIGVLSPPILAVYSTWWLTVAAPIDHFSGYAVAFEEDAY
jgi:hypothetical protein